MELSGRYGKLLVTMLVVGLLLVVVAGLIRRRGAGEPTGQRPSPTVTIPQASSERPGAAAWRVVDPYWEKVNIYEGPSVFREGFERLPEPARHLLAVRWCDSEVCNGGFSQFFFNSTGVLAPEAVEGFRAVGLPECAELVEAAMARFPGTYPRDRAARQAALEAADPPGQTRVDGDPFGDLDKRYYAARERLGFERKLDEYALRSAR